MYNLTIFIGKIIGAFNTRKAHFTAHFNRPVCGHSKLKLKENYEKSELLKQPRSAETNCTQ